MALKCAIYFLGRMLHIIGIYRISLYTQLFIDKVYSHMISFQFSVTGSDFRIENPIYLKGAQHIRIGNNFSSHKRLRLEAYNSFLKQSFNPIIQIGNNVSINYDCHIACINKIIIHDNVLIASRVFITDHFHGNTKKTINTPPSHRLLYSKGHVIIEENVWIGEGASIMPGVHIGRNVIVGANSVVTKSIEANCIVAGVPAKIIQRF